jgi:hypothetical protein
VKVIGFVLVEILYKNPGGWSHLLIRAVALARYRNNTCHIPNVIARMFIEISYELRVASVTIRAGRIAPSSVTCRNTTAERIGFSYVHHSW